MRPLRSCPEVEDDIAPAIVAKSKKSDAGFVMDTVSPETHWGGRKMIRKAALLNAARRRHAVTTPTQCLIKIRFQPIQRPGAGSARVLPFNKDSPQRTRP